jgi:hypothetical protein
MREDDGTPTGSAGGTSWSTGDTEHVGVEHYVYLLRGAMKPGELLQRIHRHVLDGCATCREAWDGLVSGQRRDLRELLAGYDEAIPFDSTPPPPTPLTRPSPYETAFSTRARTLARAAQRLAEDRRQARRQLAELLAIPAGRRERVIERAQNRWRTPAFAHLLVEEARERVRRSPREAQELLDLVRPGAAVDARRPRRRLGPRRSWCARGAPRQRAARGRRPARRREPASSPCAAGCASPGRRPRRLTPRWRAWRRRCAADQRRDARGGGAARRRRARLRTRSASARGWPAC